MNDSTDDNERQKGVGNIEPRTAAIKNETEDDADPDEQDLDDLDCPQCHSI